MWLFPCNKKYQVSKPQFVSPPRFGGRKALRHSLRKISFSFRSFCPDTLSQIHNNTLWINFDVTCASTEHVVVAYLLLVFIISKQISKYSNSRHMEWYVCRIIYRYSKTLLIFFWQGGGETWIRKFVNRCKRGCPFYRAPGNGSSYEISQVVWSFSMMTL